MYLRIQINTTLELQTHNLNPKYKIIQGRREGRLSSYHPNSRKRKTSPPDALVLPHLVVGLLFPAQWHSSLHRGDAHGLRHSRGPFFTLRQQTRQEAPSSLKRVRSASLAAGHITEGEKKKPEGNCYTEHKLHSMRQCHYVSEEYYSDFSVNKFLTRCQACARPVSNRPCKVPSLLSDICKTTVIIKSLTRIAATPNSNQVTAFASMPPNYAGLSLSLYVFLFCL